MKVRLLTFLLASAWTVLCFSAPAAEPWATPFNKDQGPLLTAARAVAAPEGADAVILLDEQHYSIDPSGRMTKTLRKVYRVVTADGVEEGSLVQQEYAPWHERKPEIRARVVTSDGTAHWLDAKTITDAPASEFDASMFSDRRVLRVPLPGVAPDSVVEYEISARETSPAFEAGSLRRIYINDGEKIQRVHLVVEAAAGVGLKYASQLIPEGTTRRTETKAGIRIECEWGPIEKRKEWEGNVPFDVATTPVFEFSTGRDWKDVAAKYSAIVDARIGTTRLSDFGGPAKAGESVKQTAARVVAELHKRVRYTGLELGDAAIVPAAPADVLARRYGDCKDKATLLVAALRAAGLKANVALLLTGMGLDVNPALPGFGLFNHAIVYVEGAEPLWIDATAQYTRVGDLPSLDQGRLALIASGTTVGLVKTPEARAADNRSIDTVEIRLQDYGKSEIHQVVETYGSAETDVRSRFGGAEAAKVKEMLERQVKPIYLVDGLSDFTTTKGDDLSQPFQVNVSLKNSGRASTEEDGASAGLFTHFIFSELPYALKTPREDGKEAEKPRAHDFVMPEAYQAEYRYRVFFPAFLKPRPLPKDQKVEMGPATFRASYRVDPSGFVEAIYRFDAGKRRLTPEEFAKLRSGLLSIYQLKPELLSFTSLTAEALALGKTGEAIRIAREYANLHPESAAAQARLARVQIAAGAGTSAVASAQKAVELDAKSTQAWQALGWALQHDAFGIRFGGRWNQAEVEKAYRKAIETAADPLVPITDLAIVLEHNAQGDRYGKDARMKDAVETYRLALKKGENSFIQQNMAIALVRAEKYDEAEPEIKKLPEAPLKYVLQLMVTGLAHGADRAILDSQSMIADPATRSNLLVNAAVTLGQMRKYELAIELLRAARRLGSSQDVETRLAAIAKWKRFDQVLLPASDPRAVAQRLFLEVLTGHMDQASLRSLMTKREAFTEGNGLAEKSARRSISGIWGRFRAMGMSVEGMADIMMSMLELTSTGDDALGYRVNGDAGGSSLPTFYVIKEDGSYRLLSSADSLENVGKLVLELAAANQLVPARQWLTLVINGSYWKPGQVVVEVGRSPLESGPNGSDSPAAKFLWNGLTEKGQTASAIRITAASLVGTFSASEEAIRILKQERAIATNKTDRGNLDLALCQAYVKAEKWTELLGCAKDLKATFAVADKSFGYVVKARMGLKQWAELEQDARTEIKAKAENPAALRAAAQANMRAGKPEKATEYIEAMQKISWVGKEEYSLAAWHSLMTGTVNEKLIQKLEGELKANDIQTDGSYLLGLLQVQAGKIEDARRTLVAALIADDYELMDARPWVLHGRIQEQLGNNDAAAAAYAEAAKRVGDGEESNWALKLATAKKP